MTRSDRGSRSPRTRARGRARLRRATHRADASRCPRSRRPLAVQRTRANRVEARRRLASTSSNPYIRCSSASARRRYRSPFCTPRIIPRVTRAGWRPPEGMAAGARTRAWYWHRWIVSQGGAWQYAYVNWETDVWSTRNNTNYVLYGGNQQTNEWFFNGVDCDGSQVRNQRPAETGHQVGRPTTRRGSTTTVQ